MKQLEEYIATQNSIEPSPYLISKIMDRLETGRYRQMSFLRQSIMVAAGIAAVILFGIIIGSGFKSANYLTINDYHIENFSILTSDDIQ